VFFEYPLTVPADTAEASPEPLEMPLCAGTVTRVDVQFPAGCSGMVYVSIWRHDHQVWPVNLDEAISGEDVVVSWPESYDLDDEPFAFTAKAWSPGTTYQHVITLRFALLSLEEAQSARGLPGLLRQLANLLLGRKS
jgi:hypothetical protein